MNRKLIAFAGVIALLLAACGASDAPQAGATAEQIEVHGHWTIDIYDPDGTLSSHNEFENALANPGDDILADVLARASAAGRWAIELTDTTGLVKPCQTTTAVAAGCWLLEPDSTLADNGTRFFNLVAGSSAGTLTLSGSATATATSTGEINRVITYLGRCAATSSPDSCLVTDTAPATGAFTIADVGPYTVEPGQQILVTVDISFS